jgi:serine/threonine-protein kinase HipA
VIKILNVFLNSDDQKYHVGKLALKNRSIYFEYEKEFLKTGIELSPYKLPLKDGVHICEDRVFDGLFGVFSDSLPDGWGKLLLDRSLMTKGIMLNDISPLDRLMYTDQYSVGALSYEPIFDNKINLHKDEILLDKLAYSSQKILRGTSEDMLDTLLNLGGSSAGARPKAMIQIDDNNNIIHGSQKLQKGYNHYIVKFASITDDYEIGKMEYIYSLMAKDAGIDISNTKLLHTKTNSYFAIERFDRIKDQRVHIHSVAGLTHSDYRLPSLDYDDLLTLALHLTKDFNEQLKIFRLAVFNLFTHNRDDHAKNFSFLLHKNKWHLSPAYDLTFSFGPGGEHSTTYLGEGKNPTIEHLKKLGNKHAIKDTDYIIQEVQEVVSRFEQYAKEIDISSSIIQKYKKQMVIK